MTTVAMASPPTTTLSRTSSTSSTASSSSLSKRRGPDLSLDLSDLPALSRPSKPSNTLIITNVNAPALYTGSALQQIRDLLQSHTAALGGVHTFSPLRSFRRIIVVFWTVEAAIAIRQALDGESIGQHPVTTDTDASSADENYGERIRVYFGEPTPLNPTDQHLHAPPSEKQFFISPPPSPPHGWEMRNEDPPNKEVHAEDLADALAKLNARREQAEIAQHEMMMEGVTPSEPKTTTTTRRERSGSRSIVYHPQAHGYSPDLPAIAVEDTTVQDDEDEDVSPINPDGSTGKILAHTARPPVELMQDT